MKHEKMHIQRSRQRKLQSVFTTHARNQPQCSLQSGTMPLQIGTGYSTLLIRLRRARLPGQFSEGYSKTTCMAMLLSNYPRVNFSICVIIQNRCQRWSMYGLWEEKMRYQNVDEKILQTCASI